MEGQTSGSLMNTRANVSNTKGVTESARVDGEMNVLVSQTRKITRNPNNELVKSNVINQDMIEIKNCRKPGGPPDEKEPAVPISRQPTSKSASVESKVD